MKKYKSPSLQYPGGKARVAKKIIAEMPPHKIYVEPFAGAGNVFFKKVKTEKNVLNDKNKELIQFFSQIKGRRLCCKVTSDKEKFMKLRDRENKTPCEQIFLNRNSYGGKSFGAKPSYGYVKQKKGGLKGELCVDGKMLEGVTLLNQDYKKAIKSYDSKETLFYVDPPYVEANKKECLYGKGFCAVTPHEVSESLKNIKGKAMVSYDDHPDVRKAFKGWKIAKITLPYSMAKVDGGKVKGKTDELLIKNF